MKCKTTTVSLIAIGAFFLGIGFNAVALSDALNTDVIKIGVVDVNSVFENSSSAKNLKSQQTKKKAELEKWLSTAKADIQKQTTNENKIKLIKKYDEEFAKKQEANNKEFSKQLAKIEKNINDTVAKTSKAKGYTVVLNKNAVLYGGDDITKDVAKAFK